MEFFLNDEASAPPRLHRDPHDAVARLRSGHRRLLEPAVAHAGQHPVLGLPVLLGLRVRRPRAPRGRHAPACQQRDGSDVVVVAPLELPDDVRGRLQAPDHARGLRERRGGPGAFALGNRDPDDGHPVAARGRPDLSRRDGMARNERPVLQRHGLHAHVRPAQSEPHAPGRVRLGCGVQHADLGLQPARRRRPVRVAQRRHDRFGAVSRRRCGSGRGVRQLRRGGVLLRPRRGWHEHLPRRYGMDGIRSLGGVHHGCRSGDHR